MRSWSGRPPSLVPRSHSTGHSLATRLDGDLERFTLRLPEHVRRKMVTTGEESLRRTGPAGRDQDGHAADARSTRLRRSDQWPSFITRTFSLRVPFWSTSRWRRGGSCGKGRQGGVWHGGPRFIIVTSFGWPFWAGLASWLVPRLVSHSRSQPGLLASGGARVTVAATPATAPLLVPLLAAHRDGTAVRAFVLPFPSHPALPAGVECAKDVPPTLFAALIVALAGLRGPLASWVRERSGTLDRVVAVLADHSCGWAQPLAAELGVAGIVFSPSGVYGSAVLHSLFRRAPRREDEADDESLISFPDLPGTPAYPWRQLTLLYQTYKEGDEASEAVRRNFLWNLEGSAFVSNTFWRLEGQPNGCARQPASQASPKSPAERGQ
ncbi:hypothetical protein BAE44_0020142 [Dichanthelium oligosanthes]|uniref:Uncharacterized protein n=1 Tax=Dichanthelium oligosanthes TaxID=888268 RepID=A0A1E5V124_9POAL|nr:hypothetical protein BAE44_0020142 [Dichanthelium oligosanthes]